MRPSRASCSGSGTVGQIVSDVDSSVCDSLWCEAQVGPPAGSSSGVRLNFIIFKSSRQARNNSDSVMRLS